MIYRAKSRLDVFALALGGVSAKSPYVGLQIIASDRINAAWDARLRAESEDRSGEAAPEGACVGWAS